MARELNIQGFVHYSLKQTGLNWQFADHHNKFAYDWYLDDFHCRAMLANLTNNSRSNIWNYQYIKIESQSIRIEHGMGYSTRICLTPR